MDVTYKFYTDYLSVLQDKPSGIFIAVNFQFKNNMVYIELFDLLIWYVAFMLVVFSNVLGSISVPS
jgi:hypothetical protein